MKLLVIGLAITTLSLAVVLWQRCSQMASPVESAPRVAKSMVWKAQRGTAIVWLCGSIHLLRAGDYPLPVPYQKAFDEAQTVVMELPPGSASDPETQQAILKAGTLPQGETLEKTVTPETWNALLEWQRGSGMDVATLQPMKPWMAALMITITAYERLGFSVSRGMETYFAAKLGNRKSDGLETAAEQTAIFDKLDAKTAEQMIMQAIEEAQTAPARVKLFSAAWHEGDARRLGALMEESIARFPTVKKSLLDDRNSAWVPRIEQFLDGKETVMILVGSGHLAGSGSVIELLGKRGVTLTQMGYRTTRPLETKAE